MRFLLAIFLGFTVQVSVAQTTGKYWYYKADNCYDTSVYYSEYSHYIDFTNDTVKGYYISADYFTLGYKQEFINMDTIQEPIDSFFVRYSPYKTNRFFAKNDSIFIHYGDTVHLFSRIINDTLYKLPGPAESYIFPLSKTKNYLVFLGEDSIVVSGIKFNVFCFFESYYYICSHTFGFDRTIFIDKITLQPVLTKSYSYGGNNYNKPRNYTTVTSFYKATDKKLNFFNKNDLIINDNSPLKWLPWQKAALYADYKNTNITRKECNCIFKWMNGRVSFYDYVYPTSPVKSIIVHCWEKYKK